MSDILAFLSWYLTATILGIVAFPIAFRFFPGLADRGAAFVKPLGLLIWGFFFWLLVSLGVLQNDMGGEVLAFALLTTVSYLLIRKNQFSILKDWFRGHWKLFLRIEVVFLIFFAGWTVVRAANPEIAYTEKPMELAFINSILKSPGFPPQDPWLSGFAISYYYFGYVIIAMLIRITGVTSGVGFNLTSAMWFGMTAAAAYGLVYDLLYQYTRQHHPSSDRSEALAKRGALLAPLFLLIAGNLEGLLEVLYARGLFWNVDGTSKFWSWLQIAELDTPPSMPASWLPNRPTGWLWWRGSRVIQDTGVLGNKIEIIDEFPFFSYLLSDLHPHVLAMPFSLLAIATALNFYIKGMQQTVPGWSLREWLKRREFWLVALILGVMGFLNTWNFPIYVGLFSMVYAFLRIRQDGWGWKRLGEFIASGLTLGIAGALLFMPFYVGFRSQAGGFLPSLEFLTRGVNFWVMFAILLVPIFAWLIHSLTRQGKQGKLLQGLAVSAVLVVGLWFISLLVGTALFAFEPWGATLIQTGLPLLENLGMKMVTASQAFNVYVHSGAGSAAVISAAINRHFTSPGTWLTLFGLIGMTWALLLELTGKSDRLEGEDAVTETGKGIKIQGFVLLLVLLGSLLTFFPEVFYLRDQFGTRMNTIFKFYFETWVIWSMAAAFASAILLAELRRIWGGLFRAVWVLLILSSLAYPVIMILNKTNQFHPAQWTLDGNAYLAQIRPDEVEAIRWLNSQPMGVISEAVGGSYTPDSEWASIQTGYPTVLGWPGHESQWRGGAVEMGSRQSDMETLYSTNSWEEALTIIRRYDIRYIYIGSYEYATYPVNEVKFQQALAPAYQNGSVTIYSVPESLLKSEP